MYYMKALNYIISYVTGNTKLSIELMSKIDTFVGPQLSTIASEIAEQFGKDAISAGSQNDQSSPKYLYFNQLNVAYKSTVIFFYTVLRKKFSFIMLIFF